MARRRRSNRRRRGRSGFLYKLLSVLAICGCLVAALTLFFRVDEIAVTGGVRYTEEQLRQATGVEMGENLYLLNKNKVAASMVEALPYLREIRIRKKLPNTLSISVEECDTPLAVVQDGVAWLIASTAPTTPGKGKIVERRAEAELGECARIDGCQLLAPSVGAAPALATDRAIRQTSLIDLLDALAEAGATDRVDAIHLEDDLIVDFDQRFTVKLRYGEDYARKLKKLSLILDSGVIQDNMSGTFDMRSTTGRDTFKPDGMP